MSDLIDRQAAIDAIRDHKRNVLGKREWDEGIAFGYSAAHEHICDIIKTLPTIDERKKGKWIVDDVESEHCSVCKHRFYISALFAVGGNDEPPCCPWCGSRMEVIG